MDLKAYYRKLREAENSIPEAYVVVVSLDTPDGGKSGVFTEVSRLAAARQIVEGRARLANAKEATAFHSMNLEAKQMADENAAVSRMQVVVVPAKQLPKGSKE